MRHGLNPFRAALFTFAAFFAGVAACGGSSEHKLGGSSGVGGDDDDNSFAPGDDDGGSTAPPISGSGCATASAVAKRQPVYLEFVLDGSGSMDSDNKWTAVVPALQSIFTQMKTEADPGVGAGLIVFSD